MANSDFARGLWPVGHLSGGVIATRPYILTTGEIIRKGEVVKTVMSCQGGWPAFAR